MNTKEVKKQIKAQLQNKILHLFSFHFIVNTNYFID